MLGAEHVVRRCETRHDKVKSLWGESVYRVRPIIEALRPDVIPALQTLKRTSSLLTKLFTVGKPNRDAVWLKLERK